MVPARSQLKRQRGERFSRAGDMSKTTTYLFGKQKPSYLPDLTNIVCSLSNEESIKPRDMLDKIFDPLFVRTTSACTPSTTA